MLDETHTHIDADDIELMVRLGIPLFYIEGLLEENVLRPSGGDTSVLTELSPSEMEVLIAGGASGVGRNNSRRSVNKQTLALNLARECRALVEQCFGQTTVANLLQILPGEVLSLAIESPPSLYAFSLTEDDALLSPQWQFTKSGTIPCLQTVLMAVGNCINPIALSRFMLAKNADLERGGEYYCPRDWLAGGFDWSPVVNIARNLTSD